MSLTLKRNLPILLGLIMFLAMLAIFLGNQPLIPYTVNAEEPTASVQADTLTTASLSNLTLAADTLPTKYLTNSGSLLYKDNAISK